MAADRPKDNPELVAQAGRLAAALDAFDAALSADGAPEAVAPRLAAPAASLTRAVREGGDG